MCFATCCPEGWKVGGCLDNDFHVWVEDEEGNIYDPSFEQNKMSCFIKNANINKPVYRDWGNEEYWFYEIYTNDWRKILSKKEKKQCSKEPVRYLKCMSNSMVNYCKLDLQGKKPKIRIGSMGWLREDGTAHWHWGTEYKSDDE